MKCPLCHSATKAPVTETRDALEALYRRRKCDVCEKSFVTYELAPPNLKMPPQHNNRRSRRKDEGVIRSTGAHLQNIW